MTEHGPSIHSSAEVAPTADAVPSEPRNLDEFIKGARAARRALGIVENSPTTAPSKPQDEGGRRMTHLSPEGYKALVGDLNEDAERSA